MKYQAFRKTFSQSFIKLTAVVTFLALLIAGFMSERPARAATSQESSTRNPLAATEQNIALGLDHFDAHCARCHGATGKGDTEVGRRLGAADLTSAKTQSKSDIELFRIISSGIPAKGMPAFGRSHKPDEIWQTVHFLRELPSLTVEKRKKLESAIPEGARHKHPPAQQQPSQPEHQHHTTPQQPAQAQRQHEGHSDPSKPATSTVKPEETAAHEHSGHASGDMSAMMRTITGGPFKSMHAIGSGSSLLPASTPGHMWMWMKSDWMLMMHGALNLVFNHQGGPRGVNKAESHNWIMAMAERDAGPGRLMLRGMFSAEPWTTPNGGFPELFQTGETFRNRPIIDAQHAHDLFMELAAAFTLPLSERVTLNLYGGPVGEPALGPVAFMHRESSGDNPSAPLGHHWQDSTHIAHGVFTAGITAWRFRAEGSIFRGKEPDEKRKDIEMGKLDSYSGRIWFTPTPNWSMQFSVGHLTGPEALEPGNLRRMTASISYNRAWQDGNWASSLIWGRNREEHGNSNSYLFESNVNFRDKNYLFTRLELIDKLGLLGENVFGRAGLEVHNEGADHHLDQWFRVGAFTFGGVRDIVAHPKFRLGVGGNVTFYHVPDGLKQLYGSSPTSYHLFLRLRPGRMAH